MQIWVDADACPRDIKELLYRTAERRKVLVTLVANQMLSIPPSEFIAMLLVPGGMNAADRRIVELVVAGDLVITADIPLAADVVAKGAEALDPRGELYTSDNIGERLAMRNLFDEMRGGGANDARAVKLYGASSTGVRRPTRSPTGEVEMIPAAARYRGTNASRKSACHIFFSRS